MTLIDARGFDFHCHVDLDRDPAALISRCERERIFTIAVTTTPKAWSQNRKWAEVSRYVAPALGLHPELVAERHGEIALLEALMPEARFIGEVGLDGSAPHRQSLPRQREVFGRILDAAQRFGGRVLTIHSRGSSDEVIAMIEEHTTKDRVRCILHWFTGTPSEALRAANLGCYFSINGQMLSNKRGQVLVKTIPTHLLLTETDYPFTQESTRAALPWDVTLTMQTLASSRAVANENMIEALKRNALEVISFAGT